MRFEVSLADAGRRPNAKGFRSLSGCGPRTSRSSSSLKAGLLELGLGQAAAAHHEQAGHGVLDADVCRCSGQVTQTAAAESQLPHRVQRPSATRR